MTPKMLFLDKEELFIMIGMLLRVMFAMEKSFTFVSDTTQRQEVGSVSQESNSDDDEEDTDMYQDILDMLALLLSHINKDKELWKECKTFLEMRYGFTLDDDPSGNGKSGRRYLKIVT